MTTVLKAIRGGHQQGDRKSSEEKSIRPHCKISIEDINWVRQQPPCVQQLWLDSVAAEQFGGAAHKLETNLTYKSLQKAGAALTAQGLFQFEEVFGRLPSGRPGLMGYRVRNLHGYYNRFYWESSTSEETNSYDEKAFHTGKESNHTEANQNHPEVKQIQPDLDHFQKNGQKNQELQGFQKHNNVSNKELTTYQQPTKVVGKVVSSSTPNENSHSEPTADAPLGGASPQTVEGVEEKEKLPAVTDCTTLKLVDALQDDSATLEGENEDLGVESKVSNEGQISAAPVASGLESEESAQVDVSTSLLDENTASAPSAPKTETQPDKWSSEALFTAEGIAERHRARPWRMEKLKLAEVLKENPGFDFLMECWNDDPALQIVIRGLVRKCPQWGYVVDGVLTWPVLSGSTAASL